MKRILAIFPIFLLASVLVLPRSEAKATEATIYFNSVPETIPYANLIAILQGGGSFDLEEYKANGGTFESFISDLNNLYGDVLNIPDNLYKKLKEEWQTTRIQQDQSIFLMPWQKENFARQIAYDSKFYQKIMDSYNPPDDTPQVYPNPDYANQLDLINSKDLSNGFFWHDSYSISEYNGNGSFTFPMNSNLYSYIAESIYQIPIVTSSGNTKNICICDLNSIYITGNNNTGYSFNTNFNNYSYITTPSNYQGFCNAFSLKNNLFIAQATNTEEVFVRTINLQLNNQSLSDCLDYIGRYCRNVNIYVNNIPWALVGGSTYTPNVDFPDVIGTNYDDLAYDVVVPVNNDLAFDLTAILQYLYGGFANTFSEAFDFSKLWDIGAIVDTTTGEAVDGADADTKTKSIPIAKAIEDEATDDATVTPSITPTPDPDGFPVITITPVPIDNALVGSTILAEIVDATQNALPSQLIDAFWGIVFICFFIGIIWTFHK